MKHFELTDQTTTAPDGSALYRIRALRDLPDQGVRAGDLGGYVAGTHNLGGNAWVSDRGQVFGNGRVSGNGRVFGNSRVYGVALVFGNSRVSGDADVSRRDHVLTISSASSEGTPATLVRTADGGHHLSVGCWDGTTADLRALADQDKWPSGANPSRRERFRPVLVAVADMCDAHMRAYEWGGVS